MPPILNDSFPPWDKDDAYYRDIITRNNLPRLDDRIHIIWTNVYWDGVQSGYARLDDEEGYWVRVASMEWDATYPDWEEKACGPCPDRNGDKCCYPDEHWLYFIYKLDEGQLEALKEREASREGFEHATLVRETLFLETLRTPEPDPCTEAHLVGWSQGYASSPGNR